MKRIFMPEADDPSHMMEPYEISLLIREAEQSRPYYKYKYIVRLYAASPVYVLADFREVFLRMCPPDPAAPVRDLDPPLSFLADMAGIAYPPCDNMSCDSRVQAAIFAVRRFDHESDLPQAARDLLQRLRSLP